MQDRDTGTLYDAKIWMNNPLEHRGYTLFQSSYQQDRGREATVLSVSKDPGQNIVFARLHHHGPRDDHRALHARRISRASEPRSRRATPRRREPRRWPPSSSPLAAATVQAAPAADTLRRLPVQHDGRSMPFDTLAREAVWKVTGAYRWHGEDPVTTVSGWVADPAGGLQRLHRQGGERRPGP